MKGIFPTPALVLVLFLALALAPAAQAFLGFGKYTAVSSEDGLVTIPVADVSDGQAHYYQMDNAGREIRFFIVKSSDGVIRAAFDACDVCYQSKKGYAQDGEFMVCSNCGQRFHSSRINEVKGGCNPAPLARVEKDGQLLIPVQDIQNGAFYF